MKLKSGLKGKGLSAEDVIKATEAVSASFEICDRPDQGLEVVLTLISSLTTAYFRIGSFCPANGVLWRDLIS